MEKRHSAAIDEKQTSVQADEAAEVEFRINVSGHVQELERNFGLISLGSLAITAGNTWLVAGGAIVSLGKETRLLGLIEQ